MDWFGSLQRDLLRSGPDLNEPFGGLLVAVSEKNQQYPDIAAKPGPDWQVPPSDYFYFT